MNKLIIYTAAFGAHDQPAELPGLEGIADLVCFTDQLLTFSTWWTKYRRPVFRTPRMDAKWYKMSARHLFPDHAWSIYLDSSIRVKDPVRMVTEVTDALEQYKSGGLAFFSHPEGQRSLEDEARFSMTMQKYQSEPCIEQVAHYREAGMSRAEPDYLLYAGGVIGRVHSSDTERFEKAWFDECVHWSVQDQLSLPFVLWRQKRTPGIIPGNIYDNEFLGRVWSGPDK